MLSTCTIESSLPTEHIVVVLLFRYTHQLNFRAVSVRSVIRGTVCSYLTPFSGGKVLRVSVETSLLLTSTGPQSQERCISKVTDLSSHSPGDADKHDIQALQASSPGERLVSVACLLNASSSAWLRSPQTLTSPLWRIHSDSDKHDDSKQYRGDKASASMFDARLVERPGSMSVF